MLLEATLSLHFFIFLLSLITNWRSCECLKWERHYCHSVERGVMKFVAIRDFEKYVACVEITFLYSVKLFGNCMKFVFNFVFDGDN